jgi:hypothetical protein
MSTVETHEPPASAAPARLSPIARAGRIFARPSSAFEGLLERGQAWIPLLFVTCFELALAGGTYQRVFVPTAMERVSQSAETNPNLTPEVMDRIEAFQTSPLGISINLGVIAIVVPIVLLAEALLLWFGASFVLGARFSYGNALAVISWSSLVGLPVSLVRYTYGWFHQSMEGLHLGLGVLVPEPETQTKLIKGLTGFLDALSPFAAWYLAVVTLGAAALSGAPRRNVAWVLVMLYLAFGALLAAVSALFSPGA